PVEHAVGLFGGHPALLALSIACASAAGCALALGAVLSLGGGIGDLVERDLSVVLGLTWALAVRCLRRGIARAGLAVSLLSLLWLLALLALGAGLPFSLLSLLSGLLLAVLALGLLLLLARAALLLP